MSLEITPDQAAIALAVQVKRQIASATASKLNIPILKTNLTNLLARADVQAALGTDLAAASAAVEML